MNSFYCKESQLTKLGLLRNSEWVATMPGSSHNAIGPAANIHGLSLCDQGWEQRKSFICLPGWQYFSKMSPLRSYCSGEFPGGLVVRTPSSHCQKPGLDPWSGSYVAWLKKKKERKREKEREVTVPDFSLSLGLEGSFSFMSPTLRQTQWMTLSFLEFTLKWMICFIHYKVISPTL